MDKYQVDQENKKNRNIPTDNLLLTQDIGKYLIHNIKSNWNFLINGSGNNRTSTLFQRIVQLYLDVEVLHRPIVIISSDGEFLNKVESIVYDEEIPRIRPFVKIDGKNPLYKPFSGMNVHEIEQTLAVSIHSDKTVSFETWNKLVFQSVCEVLERYGYELSIDNLKKVFQSKNEHIIQMLITEGFRNEVEKIDEHDNIASIINSVYQKFNSISSWDSGKSLLEQVKLRSKLQKSMPCFCFNLSDGIRKSFLDYLSEELKIISEICEPIIVLDSIPLVGDKNGEIDYFFNYLNSAINYSLTLSADACDALIPQESLTSFIKAKGFRMCFTKGGMSGENLSKIELGEYDHIVIEETKGKVIETFHFISHDKHFDYATHHEKRLRIRQEDLRNLSDKEAYFTYKDVAHLVRGLKFTKDII